jgi:hypothetical protein
MRRILMAGSSGMLDDETQERREHSDLMRKAGSAALRRLGQYSTRCRRAPNRGGRDRALTPAVLKTLPSQPRMHGYAITTRIQLVSADLLRVEEGSLYPALHRMEQQGWLRSE